MIESDITILLRDDANDIDAHAASRLVRIAAALGCPVSTFTEPASDDQDDTAELLRLWLMIEDDQDRAKVLAFVRTAVAVEPTQQAAE